MAPDRESFERLTFEHLPALHAFATRLTRDRKDAEDLVQETYLRAFRSFASFQPGTNVRAWLFRILKNAFISDRRKRSARPEPVELDALDDDLDRRFEASDVEGDPHSALRAALLGDEIEQALDELPEDFRLVVLLCLVQGFTYAEAASVLEIPVGTVMSRLHRARRHLQARLLDHAKQQGLPSAAPSGDVRADAPREDDAK